MEGLLYYNRAQSTKKYLMFHIDISGRTPTLYNGWCFVGSGDVEGLTAFTTFADAEWQKTGAKNAPKTRRVIDFAYQFNHIKQEQVIKIKKMIIKNTEPININNEMKTIQTKDFEVVKFPTVHGGGTRKTMEGNQIAITRTGRVKDSSHKYNVVYCSPALSAIIRAKGLTHVRFHIEKYTGSLFMLFLKGDATDARINLDKENNKTAVRIYNRDMTRWLLDEVLHLKGEDVKQHVVDLSRDLSNSEDFATFQLLINK